MLAYSFLEAQLHSLAGEIDCYMVRFDEEGGETDRPVELKGHVKSFITGLLSHQPNSAIHCIVCIKCLIYDNWTRT